MIQVHGKVWLLQQLFLLLYGSVHLPVFSFRLELLLSFFSLNAAHLEIWPLINTTGDYADYSGLQAIVDQKYVVAFLY